MSRIEIVGDDVQIYETVIVDPTLARVLSEVEGDQRLELFADIAEIGARVVQRRQDGDQGEMLRREVDRLEALVASASRDLVESAGADFAGAVKGVMDIVAQQLASISGRLDGALALSGAQAEVERERERGTAKGRIFEEEVAAAIDVIAAHSGDTCEHVGDVLGATGKAGDVVVGVAGAGGPARGRIVFEAKTGRLSRPEALRELDRAREQRDATFAVLVVARTESVPAQMHQLREYGGDKIVTVYDVDDDTTSVALEVAYALARARVLMTARDGQEINLDAAMASIEKAVVALEDIRRVKSAITGAQSGLEQAKITLDGVVAVARERVADVAVALQPVKKAMATDE